MIEFRCVKCGHTAMVKDEHAGKKARCPKCKTPGSIPTVSRPTPPTPPASPPSVRAVAAAVTQSQEVYDPIKAKRRKYRSRGFWCLLIASILLFLIPICMIFVNFKIETLFWAILGGYDTIFLMGGLLSDSAIGAFLAAGIVAAIFIVGLAYAGMAKGYSAACGALGFLGLIGLVIVTVLPDLGAANEKQNAAML